jgi:hypothetical protein
MRKELLPHNSFSLNLHLFEILKFIDYLYFTLDVFHSINLYLLEILASFLAKKYRLNYKQNVGFIRSSILVAASKRVPKRFHFRSRDGYSSEYIGIKSLKTA